jgi:UDP-galactopyranose mutase
VFLFIRPPQKFPVDVVNGGLSKALGALCRSHEIEVRRKEYIARDPKEYKVHYSTGSEPYYPFGKFETKECVKRYPLPGVIYFDNLRPLLE